MMSREKQIEEMAEIITSADPYVTCKGQPCLTCELTDIAKNCYSAKAIYKAGYRKDSEVAREILTDKILIDHLERACGAGGKLALARIKELKEIYEVK